MRWRFVRFGGTVAPAADDLTGTEQELLPGLRTPGLGDEIEVTLDIVPVSYDPAPMLNDIPVQ
jgi:hypothetical protein